MATKKTVVADVVDAPEADVAEDPKRFDLFAALQGRTYPTEEVTLIMDEAGMYAYNKICDLADHSPNDDDLKKARDEFLGELKEMSLKVTVRGISREARLAIVHKVMEKHPTKRDGFGNPKPNEDADEMLAQKYWESYIVQITDPSGVSMVPNSKEVEALRKQTPLPVFIAIETAINNLAEGSNSGYQQLIQDPAFLS